MDGQMIYLDNNATTREDPLVVQAMIEHLQNNHFFGNASSSHSIGMETRRVIDEAREHVRESINASHLREVVFTSGGTECNNLALQGTIKSHLSTGFHIISSPFEHPSVANLLQSLVQSHQNIHLSIVRVHSDGIVDLEHFRQLLNAQIKLVTIMHSNNEIGSIQPIEEIVQLARQHASPDVLIHTDASQSVGKVPIDVTRLGVDLLTICSHKFHGPKGIGALYVRDGVQLEPILYGAQHERGLRPGTENVLAIVGLGKACQIVAKKYLLNQRIEQMKRTRDRLYDGLRQRLNRSNEQFIIRNGSDRHSLPNTLNISFSGINGKPLVQQLKDQLAFSTGSACHEHSKCTSISTTLQAVGLSSDLARSTIRLSTSYLTTDEEIDRAIDLISDAVRQQQQRQSSCFTNGHDHHA